MTDPDGDKAQREGRDRIEPGPHVITAPDQGVGLDVFVTPVAACLMDSAGRWRLSAAAQVLEASPRSAGLGW